MTKDYHDLVIVSDLHHGSKLGLLPPAVEIPDAAPWDLPSTKSEFVQNSSQVYLWQCWEDFCSRLPPEFDTLVINGEAIHGPSTGKASMETMEHHPGIQALLAHNTLEPLVARAKQTYMTEGSQWHTGEWGRAEDALAYSLGCEKHPGGRLLQDMLFLNIGGVVIDIAHEQSYFMIYRSTPLEREINFALIDEAIEEGAPDLIIRSHVHTWGLVRNRHGTALTTPAWAVSNRYARKKSKARGRIGDIGGIWVRIYPETKHIDVSEILYHHPRYKSVAL